MQRITVKDKVTEEQIFNLVVNLLKIRGSGMTITDLKKNIRNMIKFEGDNATMLDGRNDQKIDQIIRNLVSHRDLCTNYIRDLIFYDENSGVLTLKP